MWMHCHLPLIKKHFSMSAAIQFIKIYSIGGPESTFVLDCRADILNSNVKEKISLSENGPNKLFPDGVNVSFVKLLEPGEIFVRTYERRVGFTSACGTPMSAASLVTCLNGFNETENEITVYNNGGK